MSDKGSSYFNIFECGRNILDQLDVTYQRAFTASAEPSSAPKGYHQPSPAQERYYDMWADHIEENNDRIDKMELRKSVSHVKDNYDVDHERNIKDMIQDDDYESPWKNKYSTIAKFLTTVNNTLDDTGYTYLDSYHTYSSGLDKKPDAIKNPIKDDQTIKETIKDDQTIKDPIKDDQTIKEPIKGPHIVNRVRYLMDGPTNMNPFLTGVGIIGK